MNKVSVKLYSKTGNIPKYETEGSAGMDIKAMIGEAEMLEFINKGYTTPSDLYKDDKYKNTIVVKPLDRILIKTGLYVEIPIGYEIQVRPRRGLAIKVGVTLLNSPDTIDSDYRGDIGIIIYNSDPKHKLVISNGDKIAQLVLKEVPKIKWDLVDSQKDLGSTVRGEGGFGHTGK